MAPGKPCSACSACSACGHGQRPVSGWHSGLMQAGHLGTTVGIRETSHGDITYLAVFQGWASPRRDPNPAT
ncbi:hypothetical protein T440DRAFT_295153 [Plenodomus tracheiphilus IPT5]|uniref:Uncharacterized protein n=1 Tax=Plenodomus tracheiphilus IPT5 TaxID=1408161 RepID=A0A6A7BEW6_9PLEO|nr:hypothetical protein T440DRAFT_295153 [Plenodomus tracheiphilus IPT5]